MSRYTHSVCANRDFTQPRYSTGDEEPMTSVYEDRPRASDRGRIHLHRSQTPLPLTQFFYFPSRQWLYKDMRCSTNEQNSQCLQLQITPTPRKVCPDQKSILGNGVHENKLTALVAWTFMKTSALPLLNHDYNISPIIRLDNIFISKCWNMQRWKEWCSTSYGKAQYLVL